MHKVAYLNVDLHYTLNFTWKLQSVLPLTPETHMSHVILEDYIQLRAFIATLLAAFLSDIRENGSIEMACTLYIKNRLLISV